MAEGTPWKNKKKVLSKIFNYDFITSQIPSIVSIADNVFDFYENEAKKDGKKYISLQINEMITKFTSSVIVSGFLGTNSLKENIRGESIG